MHICFRTRAKQATQTLVVTASIASVLPTFPSAAQSEDTIIVTASPFEEKADRFATHVDAVSRDAILAIGGASLADALRNIPGVTGSGFAVGASRPVIRGFDANRVRITENGVGSFDVSDVGPDHGVPIDPLSALRIEVVRGAATLRYGSQAIGGVINAINNRVPLAPADRPVTAELSGTLGTNGDLGEGSGLIDAGVDGAALHVDGFRRDVGSYAIPGGEQANSYFHGGGYSIGGSAFVGERSRVGAAFIHYDSRYGLPGEQTFIDMTQNKGLFGASFGLDYGPLETLNVDMGYANYNHRERDIELGPLATFADKEWDVRAETLMGAMGPFSALALGVQAQNRRFSGLGEGEDFLRPAISGSIAGFGFAQTMLSRSLRLELSTRLETARLEGVPASDIPAKLSFTLPSGSVGIVYDATETATLGLTVTSAARAPSQTEVFARGPHEGTGTFETGDPLLRAERSNSIEAILRLGPDHTRFEGAAWAAKFQNYIYGALTGRSCDEDGNCVNDESFDLRELEYRQQSATFWGLEARSTLALVTARPGVLALNLSADMVRASLDNGENVPRLPPYHVGGGLAWESQFADLAIRMTYAGRQSRAGAGDTPTDGFVSLDSNVTIRPFTGTRSLAISIVGHNLTNSVQRNAVSFNKDEVVQPGRDVRLVFRVKL